MALDDVYGVFTITIYFIYKNFILKEVIGQKIWFAFQIQHKSEYKYLSEPWIPVSALFFFPYLITDYGISRFETDGPIFHSQSTFNILLDASYFIFKMAHGYQQS